MYAAAPSDPAIAKLCWEWYGDQIENLFANHGLAMFCSERRIGAGGGLDPFASTALGASAKQRARSLRVEPPLATMTRTLHVLGEFAVRGIPYKFDPDWVKINNNIMMPDWIWIEVLNEYQNDPLISEGIVFAMMASGEFNKRRGGKRSLRGEEYSYAYATTDFKTSRLHKLIATLFANKRMTASKLKDVYFNWVDGRQSVFN